MRTNFTVLLVYWTVNSGVTLNSKIGDDTERNFDPYAVKQGLLLSSSLSPLCRVFIHTFLRQTMSLRNTMLQLFCRYCLVPISLVPVLTLMYFYISTFRSMCAVPNMAVFCSSLTSWFPGVVQTRIIIIIIIIIIINVTRRAGWQGCWFRHRRQTVIAKTAAVCRRLRYAIC
jgi:hypothetical protein